MSSRWLSGNSIFIFFMPASLLEENIPQHFINMNRASVARNCRCTPQQRKCLVQNDPFFQAQSGAQLACYCSTLITVVITISISNWLIIHSVWGTKWYSCLEVCNTTMSLVGLCSQGPFFWIQIPHEGLGVSCSY